MGHGHGLDVSNGAAQPDHTSRHTTGQAGERGCVVVRSDDRYDGKQGLSLSAGISTVTAGSRALCMHMVVIPPGSRGTPHLHDGHETAIWIASGEVEVWHGPDLAGRTVLRAGDFLYIPPGIPHLPVNHGSVPMVCVIARTDPAEQESVVVLDLPAHLDPVRALPVAAG
jgi:uncharacterized RmlC-like cupin family protein